MPELTLLVIDVLTLGVFGLRDKSPQVPAFFVWSLLIGVIVLLVFVGLLAARP